MPSETFGGFVVPLIYQDWSPVFTHTLMVAKKMIWKVDRYMMLLGCSSIINHDQLHGVPDVYVACWFKIASPLRLGFCMV